MTKVLIKKLNESKAARWTALAVVSFTMMCGYFISDCMSPLEDLLVSKLGWTNTEYGIFSGSYGIFNVFFFMLLIGGLILDKKGIRFTGLGACITMVLGAAIKCYAVSPLFMYDGTIFGLHASVVLACIGFATFGVGVEIAGITVSKVIVKWFTGHELALAMGLQVATARIGTAVALSCCLPIARYFHDNVAMPILFGVLLLCIGTIAFLVYNVMDRKLDESIKQSETNEEEGFRISDIKIVVTNKGFWLITMLCILFYSAVFPFLKFATKMMIYKYDVSPDLAGTIPSLLPFGTILLTPLFGSIYDRIGKGATLMMIGAFLLVLVHGLFAMPFMNVWWFATINMIFLGIAFSLVPSAMWPSVPKIIPHQILGTAYALIFYVQNIGLTLVPMLMGWVNEKYSKTILPNGEVTYNYTYPMLIFMTFGILAFIVALMLKSEDKKKGYGLEQANIKK